MIFHIPSWFLRNYTLVNNYIFDTSLKKCSRKQRDLLVIDKRNTIILENDKPKICDRKTESFRYKYGLMILLYFDIFQQNLSVVQYILYPKIFSFIPQKILKYVMNNFIEIEGINNKWYHNLMNILQQMNHDSIQPKLNLYHLCPIEQILKKLDANGRIFTHMHAIQINNEHPWYTNHVKTNNSCCFILCFISLCVV